MSKYQPRNFSNVQLNDLIKAKAECDAAVMIMNLTQDPVVVYRYAKSIANRKHRAFFNIGKKFGRYLDSSGESSGGSEKISNVKDVEERVRYLDSATLSAPEKGLIQLSKDIESRHAEDVSQRTLYSLSKGIKRKLSFNDREEPPKKFKLSSMQPEELSKNMDEFCIGVRDIIYGRRRNVEIGKEDNSVLAAEIGLFFVEFLLSPCDLNVIVERSSTSGNDDYWINLKSNAFLAYDPDNFEDSFPIKDSFGRMMVEASNIFGRAAKVNLTSREMYMNFTRNDITEKFVDPYFFVICYIKAVAVGFAQIVNLDPKTAKERLYVVNEWLYQCTVYLVVISCILNDMSLNSFVAYRRANPKAFSDYGEDSFFMKDTGTKVLELACWMSTRNYKYDDPDCLQVIMRHCGMYAALVDQIRSFHHQELIDIYKKLYEELV